MLAMMTATQVITLTTMMSRTIILMVKMIKMMMIKNSLLIVRAGVAGFAGSVRTFSHGSISLSLTLGVGPHHQHHFYYHPHNLNMLSSLVLYHFAFLERVIDKVT